MTAWTAADHLRLFSLRERGLSWIEVAERMPGRTRVACSQNYYNRKEQLEREGALDRPRRLQVLAIAAALSAQRAKPELVCDQQHSAVVSTGMLRDDVELRARISERGITGGLLGDPAPGRSALDMLRAGPKAPAARKSRRHQKPQPAWLRNISVTGQS